MSHDVRELASIAHHSYLMAGGEIVAEGTPAELAGSEVPIVRQFISGNPDGPSPFHYPAPDLTTQLLAPVAGRRTGGRS